MVKTFSFIRRVHLYSAFVIAAFLLMYFITGLVLVMESFFPRNPISETTGKQLIPGAEAMDVTVARLCKQYQLQGQQRKSVQHNKTIYTYFKPGYKAEIVFKTNTDSLTWKIKKGSFGVVMNDFHRLRGFDTPAHFVWGVLYDLSAIALIAFALTGVYLWLKTAKNKLTGKIFLLISTAVTAFTIWYLVAVC